MKRIEAELTDEQYELDPTEPPIEALIDHALLRALDGRPYPPRRYIRPGVVDARWPIEYKDVWLKGFVYVPPPKDFTLRRLDANPLEDQ